MQKKIKKKTQIHSCRLSKQLKVTFCKWAQPIIKQIYWKLNKDNVDLS